MPTTRLDFDLSKSKIELSSVTTKYVIFYKTENFVLVPHQSLAYTHIRAMDKELGDNSLRTKPVSFDTEICSRL